MTVNIINVACVYETYDEYGRLGDLVVVCRNLADAEIAAKGKGWYGGQGRVLEKKAIQIGDDIYPLIDNNPWKFKDVEELRAKEKLKAFEDTLKKLTPEMAREIIREIIREKIL